MYIWAHRIRAIHRGGHEQQLLAVAAGQVAPDSTDAYPNAPQRTPTPPERYANAKSKAKAKAKAKAKPAMQHQPTPTNTNQRQPQPDLSWPWRSNRSR